MILNSIENNNKIKRKMKPTSKMHTKHIHNNEIYVVSIAKVKTNKPHRCVCELNEQKYAEGVKTLFKSSHQL